MEEKKEINFGEETYKKITEIKLADDNFKEQGLRIRVVKIYFDPKTYTCLTIDQLKEILKLWIIGEEERYPQEEGFQGRWMLFNEIKKLFMEV